MLKAAKSAERKGDYELAFSQYSSYLKQKPNDKRAISKKNKLGKKLALEELEKIKPQLEKADLTVPELEQIAVKLESLDRYDTDQTVLQPAKASVSSRIASIRNGASQRVRDFENAVLSKDISYATEIFKEIKSQDPENPELALAENDFANSFSTHFNQKVIALFRADKDEEAQAELSKLAEVGFSDENLSQIVSSFKQAAGVLIKERIRKDIAAKRYYKAYLAILQHDDNGELNEELKQVKKEGADFYLRQAKARQSKGQNYRAYLEAVKGHELNPDAKGMFETYRDLQDKVVNSLQKNIAISAFGAPNQNPDLGTQFSDALISHLFRILPFGVNILEREKIDLALEEKKRELKKVSDILNVDLIVTGNVSLMDIDTQESKRVAKTKAKIGSRQEINPEYQRYQKLRRKKGIAIPPKTISVPEYDTVEYRKGRVVLKAFATVSARIFNAREGSITFAQEFNAKYEAIDDFQEGVEGSEIEDDPIDLPTDTEVASILKQKLVVQISEVIEEQFSKQKNRFAQDAEVFIQRKEIKKAMRPLAQGFLFSVKSDLSPKDESVAKLRNLIIEHTERDFL